jgi:hypothetical protein
MSLQRQRIAEALGREVGIQIPPYAQPFLIENYASLTLNIDPPPGGTPVKIVEWVVPQGQVAVLEAFSIQAATPHPFHECTFDVAVDEKEVQSIRFVHLTSNVERPPNFVRLFEQKERIQLRVYFRETMGGNVAYMLGWADLVFGRLSGKTWAINV